MNNTQVAEAFANGRTRGTGSNMFLEDNTCFSYGHHFPISRRYEGYYLFNTRNYSMTTAKHKSHVYRYLPHDRIIMITDCDPNHAEQQVKNNKEQILEMMEKRKRARTRDYSEGIKDLLHQNHLIGTILLKRDWKEIAEKDFIQELVLEAL